MPGLVACGRRWDIGSDDLVFPAIAEVQVRGVWLVAIAVIFGIHRDILPLCSNGHLLSIYYIGMLILLTLHIVTDIAILRVSMRGTIMDDRPRQRMPLYLYFKIPLFLPEFAWTTLGTYWAFRESTCEPHVVWTVKGAVIVGWIIMLVLLIGLWVVFDPLGSHSSQHEDTEMEATAAAARLWETRCSVLCCCVRGDEESKNAFNEIAKMISNFFKGVDLVPTDIAAGLILLQVEQRKHSHAVRMVPITYLDQSSSGTEAGTTSQGARDGEGQANTNEQDTAAAAPSSDCSLQPSPTAVYIQLGKPMPGSANANLSSLGRVYPQPTDWMNIPAAAHYMRFAAASYGWPLFMYSNLFTGACQLCTHCRCCACVKSSSHIVDDDCCGCNVAAILRMTDIHEEDIVYASFYNRVYEIPFFVALDHQHRTVVVAIRGTLSLRDALTDLTAHSECIELEEVGDGRAHKGILQAARYIKNTLNNMQLLETAFQRGQGYRLVITGHSLGAGAATLVSVLLRPQYPNLICYAFSPPGLVSLPLSRHTESFVCSVVVGQDLVPRLGVSSMEHLKVQLLQLIRDSSKPKYKLLASGCWYALFGVPRSKESQSLLRSQSSHRSYDDMTGSQHNLDVEQPLEEPDGSGRHQCDIIPLYVPGHVMYIEESSDTGLCCGTPTYVAGWARAEMFNEIIVSPKMVLHHLPDIVMKALDQLAEQHSVPHYIAQPQRS